jgi:hypothetical protein
MSNSFIRATPNYRAGRISRVASVIVQPTDRGNQPAKDLGGATCRAAGRYRRQLLAGARFAPRGAHTTSRAAPNLFALFAALLLGYWAAASAF